MKNPYENLCDIFQGDRRMTLLKHLTKRHEWHDARANRAINQYVMFLSLAAEKVSEKVSEKMSEEAPEKMSGTAAMYLVPTTDIDCVWEADILQNTAQYIQLCQSLCGEVIHHVQDDVVKNMSGIQDAETAFSQTKALLTQRFGREALDAPSLSMAACGVLVKPVQTPATDEEYSSMAACGVLINH